MPGIEEFRRLAGMTEEVKGAPGSRKAWKEFYEKWDAQLAEAEKLVAEVAKAYRKAKLPAAGWDAGYDSQARSPEEYMDTGATAIANMRYGIRQAAGLAQ